MLTVTIRIFDSIRTGTVVDVALAAFVAFGFIRTVGCFMSELLTMEATIDTDEWFLGNSRIAKATEEDV